MKKFLLALLVMGCVGAGWAQEQPEAQPPKKEMRDMHRPHLFAEMKLTDAQKAQMKNIRYETRKHEIELKAKLEMSQLELTQLVSADEPDKEAIQKKISEVASDKTALAVNKLNGWFETNKILTPEQQKVWKDVLRMTVAERMGHERGREMPHRPPVERE